MKCVDSVWWYFFRRTLWYKEHIIIGLPASTRFIITCCRQSATTRNYKNEKWFNLCMCIVSSNRARMWNQTISSYIYKFQQFLQYSQYPPNSEKDNCSNACNIRVFQMFPIFYLSYLPEKKNGKSDDKFKMLWEMICYKWKQFGRECKNDQSIWYIDDINWILSNVDNLRNKKRIQKKGSLKIEKVNMFFNNDK